MNYDASYGTFMLLHLGTKVQGATPMGSEDNVELRFFYRYMTPMGSAEAILLAPVPFSIAFIVVHIFHIHGHPIGMPHL